MRDVGSFLEIAQKYFGGWLFAALFLATILYFGMRGHARTKILIVVSGALIALSLNDHFFAWCTQIGGKAEYYRFLWMLPVIPLISCLIIDIKNMIPWIWLKGVFLVLFMALILNHGVTYLTQGEMVSPPNIYGVGDDVIEVAELIEANETSESPIVVCDTYLFLRLRQYDASLRMGIWRAAYLAHSGGRWVNENAKSFLNFFQAGCMDPQGISKMKTFLMQSHADMIVVKKDIPYEADTMEILGFAVVGETAEYRLYMPAVQ